MPFVFNLTTKNTKDTKIVSHAPLSELAESAARQSIDAALAVHKALGPGLLESAYVILFKQGLKRLVL
jgi:hypothetical protein